MRLQVVASYLGAPGTPAPEPTGPRGPEGTSRRPGLAAPGFLPARGDSRCGHRSAARGHREPPPLLPGAASGVRGEGRRQEKQQHRRAATPAELPPARGDFAAPQRRPPARGAAQAAEEHGRAGECSSVAAAARRPPGTGTMVCHPRRGEFLAPRSSSSGRRAGPAPGLSLNPARARTGPRDSGPALRSSSLVRLASPALRPVPRD